LILKKRDHYRRVFDRFDPVKVAAYDRGKIEALMNDSGIIRNRLKVEAAKTNARAFLTVQKAYGSFNAYIWEFVGGKTMKNAWKHIDQIPAQTGLSQRMSKDLKKRGFKFVGPTICYAFMQAVGMVNDHVPGCFRPATLAKAGYSGQGVIVRINRILFALCAGLVLSAPLSSV